MLVGLALIGSLFVPTVALAAIPTVTIEGAWGGGQLDPTNTTPINFTVTFSEAVTGFATGDVALSGSAGATTAIVTGSGATYNVAVSGMTGSGSVIASVPAAVAQNATLEDNAASTSVDNNIAYDLVGPTVTIDQAVAQVDPATAAPINFTVVFSEVTANFGTGDVTITGTAGGTKTAVVTGTGTTYNVAVSGMTTSGSVIATVAAGVATDEAGNANTASTSTDNTVTWTDATSPSVTINQAGSQPDPTGSSPINFTVVFSEPVSNFVTGDVTITGTSGGAKTGTVSGSGTTYNVAVTGMTTTGTVVASIGAGVATDAAANPNTASTSTDNTVTWTPGGPTVTINQAVGQADPTFTSPINFTVVFSAIVTGFATGDVALSGTAGATTAVVTGSGTTYNVAVSGMTTNGTVIASIPADVAINAGSQPNVASTSTDNTVTWSPGPSVTINQAVGQPDPTGTSPINFTVVFSAAVTGFATGDVALTGTAGATTAIVTGSGTTYNVAVSGMTVAGTVIATVPAGVAVDGSLRSNVASTSTDNVVAWSPGGPTVTINQAAAQGDPTNTSPINFTVVFSSAVTGFATGDVVISGTAGGTKTATVTGSGTTYNVAVSGMTTAGTVIATVPGAVALDTSVRPNVASTSTDNTVTWSPVATSIVLTTSAPTPPGAKDPVILWGQGITLTVQFGANGASKSFLLQGTRDGVTWTTITTLTTNASGRASLFYTPVTNLYYRAVFAGTPDLAASNSNQVRTVVRQLAVLRPTNSGSTKSISRNASITFTTTVRPARPELALAKVSFFFYKQVSGVWQLQTTRDVFIDSAGLARTTFKFTSSGQWYVRSQANPTTYNANSVMTPVERYSVR
jgi:hypothetical protein